MEITLYFLQKCNKMKAVSISFFNSYCIKTRWYFMNKAVVFYSLTGNTKIVANLFEGYDQLEITTNNNYPQSKDNKLVRIPDISNYEEIIFACPTHGMRMAKPMVSYIEQLETLENKHIHVFITHFFPFKWMGGTQTLKQFKKMIEKKSGTVDQMVSVNWKSKRREQLILNMLEKFDIKKSAD